jgi:hypothetical protein
MKKVSRLDALTKWEIMDKVTSPSTEKLKELRNNIVKYVEKEYFHILPLDAQLFIQKYPQFCQRFSLHHKGYTTMDVFYITSLNDNSKTKESKLLFSRDVVIKIDNMIEEYENYKEEVEKLQSEVNEILKLSVKQVVEHFPDIAIHIPERESINNVDSINLKIKNQPL